MHLKRAASFLAILLLAGCLDPGSGSRAETPPATPSSKDEPDTTPSDETAPNEPAPRLATGRVELTGCRGIIPTLDVPQDRVRPVVPEDFEPDGPFPGLARVNFHAMRCERLVSDDEVVADVSLLVSKAVVRPTNASWQGQAVNAWTFDVMVNDAVAQRILATWSTGRVQLADFAEEAVAGTENPQATQWRFESPNVTYAVTVFGANAGQASSSEYEIAYWSGAAPYLRHNVTQAYSADPAAGNSKGVLELSGSSPLLDVLEAETIPIDVLSFDELSWTTNTNAVPYS